MYSNNFNLQMFSEEAVSPLATDTSVADVTDAGPSSETDASQNLDGTEDHEETFDSLIHGRYANEYNEAVKGAIAKRFRNQADLQGRLDKITPILAVFADKYGMRPGEDGNYDLDELAAKVNDDDSFYEEEAFRRGMSVGDFKQMKRLERENAVLQRQQEEQAREEESRAEFDKLVAAGEEIKQIYPSFDLRTELANDDFMRLLTRGIDPKTAYEVAHKDEIISSGMQYAVERTKENVSRAIQSGMNRPSENGVSPKATADISKIDPRKLNLSQIRELNDRAARGETITFR